MIELLVMRHAKSDWNTGDNDFNRPLNDRGVRAAARMADWIVGNELVPDRVISSPAMRTRSTALAVVDACAIDSNMVDFDDDVYLAGAFAWLQLLTRQTDSRILICGHNPGLDDLVLELASSPPTFTLTGKLMTTAAVAHFSFTGDWSSIGPQKGTLLTLTRPRDFD